MALKVPEKLAKIAKLRKLDRNLVGKIAVLCVSTPLPGPLLVGRGEGEEFVRLICVKDFNSNQRAAFPSLPLGAEERVRERR